MKIESVDLFYLSMPEVLDIGDGSQDALLVRIRAGGLEGWGECEASPLTSIASYVCPMSHSACKPVKYALEGMKVDTVEDIYRISSMIKENSADLLQTDHTLSGIDIALWDLLGKKREVPVYQLLGYKKVYPKVPYASQLFGDTPEATYEKARHTRASGFSAVKFGWGPIGRDLDADNRHFRAAREGMGNDAYVMFDIGTVWNENVAEGKKRLPVLKEVNAYWLEEPFINLALDAYRSLSDSQPLVPLAGGEGCNNFVQADAMLKYAGLKFIQIDAGRIGGITVSKKVADLAQGAGVTYVNHTFTSHLALSASLQSFAGIESSVISEYPVELKELARNIGSEKIERDGSGNIHVPERPGLGISVNAQSLREYLVDVEIRVKGKTIYYTPEF